MASCPLGLFCLFPIIRFTLKFPLFSKFFVVVCLFAFKDCTVFYFSSMFNTASWIDRHYRQKFHGEL